MFWYLTLKTKQWINRWISNRKWTTQTSLKSIERCLTKYIMTFYLYSSGSYLNIHKNIYYTSCMFDWIFYWTSSFLYYIHEKYKVITSFVNLINSTAASRFLFRVLNVSVLSKQARVAYSGNLEMEKICVFSK